MKRQSAALDLMESFGFEGGVEPTSPNDNTISFLSTATTHFQQQSADTVVHVLERHSNSKALLEKGQHRP